MDFSTEFPAPDHEAFMRLALSEAEHAFEEDEAPIGAIIVSENKIIGRGYNRTRSLNDATAHAEMIAITSATETVADWRLLDCDLYCTLEPCIMCSGAAVLARVRHIYFGAQEPKFGGCGSIFSIPDDTRLNHTIEITGGILQEESAQLMRDFFQRLRRKENRTN